MDAPQEIAMSILWSPDFDDYASGKIDISRVRCVLCEQAACMCPPFGTPEYFALIDYRHGRTGGEPTLTKSRHTVRFCIRSIAGSP